MQLLKLALATVFLFVTSGCTPGTADAPNSTTPHQSNAQHSAATMIAPATHY